MGQRIFLRRNPNTTYAYLVRAKNAFGELGAWSDPAAKVTTDVVPPLAPPTKIEAWPMPLMNMIQVFWSNAKIEQRRMDIVSYKLYRTTHGVAASVTENDLIAEVKGLSHFDYSKDFKGVATSGSSGSTLKNAWGTFRSTMNGERILNMGTIASPKSSYGTITYVNSQTITAALSGGDVWAQNDRFIVDYAPLRNVQYYYWVKSVSQEGRESALSESDGAKLGKPGLAIIDSFAEDESEDFLWLKGWAMTFHCTEGAEGYHIRWRRFGNYLWTVPVTIHHEGEPDDPQTFVFKNKIVNQTYEFAVRPINHVAYRDYWGEWVSSVSTVQDAGNPLPPTDLKLFQGPFNNWMSWKQSASKDVKDYQIYRKQRTGAVPSTPTGSELNHPYVFSWPAFSAFFIDPIAGAMDRKNWYYWIRARDWNNNASTLAGPVGEVDSMPMVIPTEEQLLFGIKLTWAEVSGAAYYKIYRSLVDDPNTATCIAPFWFGTVYIDLLRNAKRNYYWVRAVSSAGVQSLFSTMGVPADPGLPNIDTDTIGPLPESRLSLTYSTIELMSAIQTKISAGDVNGVISTLNITPRSVTVSSGGYIALRSSSDRIYLIEGADLVWTGSQSEGWPTRAALNVIRQGTNTTMMLRPGTNNAGQLAFGNGAYMWDRTYFYTGDLQINASKDISLLTANKAQSQVIMRLPTSPGAAQKSTWQLVVDLTDSVGDNYAVRARWISN